MATVVSATEARVRFGELIRRVCEERETYFVERSGERQVVVMSIAEYDALVRAAHGEGRRGALEHAFATGQRLRTLRGGSALDAAEDVVRAGREERDRDLADLR